MILLLPVLASCAPPVGDQEGNLTIILPGGSGAARTAFTRDDINEFTYTLDFYGPGGERRREETSVGAQSVTLTLAWGEWTVRADAWHKGERVGTGEASFTVSGRGNSVTIPMRLLEGHGFLSDSDIEDFGPIPFDIETIFTVNNATDWDNAVYAIAHGGSGKNYIINLGADITIPGSAGPTFGGTMAIKVSLRGAHTLTVDWDGTNDTLLNLGAEQTLILRESILAGVAANTLPLVSLNASTSKFYMRSGKISGNTTTYSVGGGGVYIYGGSFTMYGGVISGNATSGGGPGNGGGVHVGNSGIFTMEGGVISGNSTTATGSGGGVYVSSGGSFSKSGGIIYGDDAVGDDANGVPLKNTAPSAVSGKGHAVYVDGSTRCRDTTAGEDDDIDTSDGTGLNSFLVNNATAWNTALTAISGGGNDKNYIINLTAGFALNGLSSTEWSFGSVSGVTVSLRGVGTNITLSLDPGSTGSLLRVAIGQELILRELTLQGHTTNDAALVYVNGSTLSMKAGTTIKDNINIDTNANGGGGGVFVDGGAFTMQGGEISGNSAYAAGGGVAVADGTFTMGGGVISDNSADYGGGGVAVNGTFTMGGGEISGNTADYGGGVYVYGGSFTKTGGGTVYGGDAIGNDGNGVPLENTAASSAPGNGHAVYYNKDSGYYRDTTLTATDDISTDDTVSGWGQ